ncbi:flagellar basal-body MS-ring/collar protein FliF [Vallitalea guaymasensis]|uniref:Flagellar M-ring protein FliF n=1 Tax=Vallitalea guaymasensis TaxID=1185412 RepID=A0A8J8SED9_9FIRM|nr:flagellar basal-body MS-ring/collar protein FliF [Vallitalea guaymasensis]QUH31436.1 flagellar M-ring protein FliF [Vallitalea guaymasensis]
MPGFISKISDQITGFWNKFDKKQKLQIIAAVVVTVIALSILTIALNKTKMVPFVSGLEPKTTNQVKTLLQEQGIKYEVRDNASSVYVDKKRKQDAQMALDSMGIISNTGMTYKEAFNSSLSTTEAEKRAKHKLAFENELGDKISVIEDVESAVVKLVTPDQDRTIFDDVKEAKASAILTTSHELTDDQVVGIANFLASSVENLDLKNVRILNNSGKMLYYGEDIDDNGSSLNKKINYEVTMENKIEKDVLSILLGEFDDAVVTADLIIDFDAQSSIKEEYTTPEGQSKGIPSSEYHYESEGSNQTPSGVPGTDSNNGTTDYLVPNNSNSDSSTKIDKVDYDVSKTVTNETKHIGNIKYNESSVSISAKKYKIYDQALLKKQGVLDNISWEEYKAQNSESKKIAIDDDLISLVKNAANGSKVEIIGYEVPSFIPISVKKKPITDYIFIAIIVIMIALLGYAVYKGTEPVEVTEIQPELSVEDMLASTREQQDLEEIEFDDKSDTRVQIEKFVDEKPDAVAQLLRNWLNEDWE